MTLYIPAMFRVSDEKVLAEFIERHAFGTMVTTGDEGLAVSHIPFVVERGAAGTLRLLGHVARANDHWRRLEAARELVVIFQGPHAYVSPTWYAEHPAVPTWNYTVAHAHGRARLLDEKELRNLLEKLSATYEAHRKPAWRLAEAPADFVAKLMRAIVGFEIEVQRLEGKFKLSQNRPAEAPRVIEALEAAGETALAALMREHPPRREG